MDWQSANAARSYQSTADILIPGRRDILSLIARLVVDSSGDRPKVLDLGCGYGDVTAEILKLRPDATICMVDYSDEMIRMAEERFRDNNKIKVFKQDLNAGVPSSLRNEGFDAVVSCFALHHVDYENRIPLYTDIRVTLKSSGLFVNGDRFKGDSEIIDRWEFDNWISWMVERIRELLHKERTFDQVKNAQIELDLKLGDKPGTIMEMAHDMIESGFHHVDCVWKYQTLAVMVTS
ncbi:MAG: class I SAM-dependent methyltransferase [Dehalococcoidales bacterium]|nr:class I SAM-dependent methyltransferase [Dehalococcoidales bacterium]